MSRKSNHEASVALSPHFSVDEDADLAAWTEIEAGRFMPRRVRGSYLGRALG
jgi:hypothetical protein